MIKINYYNSKGFGKEARKNLKAIFEYGLKSLNQNERFEINFSMVNEQEIKSLNFENRKINKSTDVLSFPSFNFVAGEIVDNKIEKYQTNYSPETGAFMLGDIIICGEVAKNQATIFGHSFESEIIKLAVHSFLHCLGYDHLDDSDYETMKNLENKLLTKFGYTME